MPECCMNCPLSVSVNFGLVCCPISTILPDSKLFDDDGNALEKPSWCPIIEVPPHGRLIDADELKDAFCCNCFCDDNPMECVEPCMDMKILLEAPTVIPADKDGEP